MRFWLVIGWRNAWAMEGVIEARAFASEAAARTVADTHNGVLVEVYQSEKDFKTYVDIHDYELRDDKNRPAPVTWEEVAGQVDLAINALVRRWAAIPSPVVRVGHDIGHKAYEEMVKDE